MDELVTMIAVLMEDEAKHCCCRCLKQLLMQCLKHCVVKWKDRDTE